ncbi:hypothetical protein [Halocatena pleomorpha]|uniref:Uncharacterized protein n=1 Tax=Halocatena pleomorpha TaxID=1785090 RepID=A0A3P3R801_9EURY|nr:hypothetical protein [Halocatena pleomorpha]RRJ29577.1 hypothetical protein EIK79_13155 [Halocatena pleomorpha]
MSFLTPSSNRRYLVESIFLLMAATILVGTGLEHFSELSSGLPQSDATVIVKEARRLASDWTTLGTTWDPLLRYVGLATVYTALGHATSHTAVVYTILILYVVIPVAIYGFASVISGPMAGAIAVVFVTVSIQFAIPLYGYATEMWQYPFVLPFILTAFITTHLALCDRSDRFRWPVVTGALLGVAGLQQFSLTAYAVATIFLTYGLQRRFKQLTVTAGVGGLFLLGLVFQPGDIVTHLFWYSDRHGQLTWTGLETDPAEIWATISGQRHALIIGWYSFVLTAWHNRGFAEVNPILKTGVILCALCWMTRFDSAAYYAESSLMIATPLLATASGEIFTRQLSNLH